MTGTREEREKRERRERKERGERGERKERGKRKGGRLGEQRWERKGHQNVGEYLKCSKEHKSMMLFIRFPNTPQVLNEISAQQTIGPQPWQPKDRNQ